MSKRGAKEIHKYLLFYRLIIVCKYIKVGGENALQDILKDN